MSLTNTTVSNYINNINVEFPVPGQANSTEPFRTNFANIQAALTGIEQGVETLGVQYSTLNSGEITNNGYQTFPNGLIMQWGQSGVIPSGENNNIVYPTPFPNAVFSVTVTPITTATSGNVSVITVSNFNINNTAGGASEFYWSALGN
jgi:hypothetical protein